MTTYFMCHATADKEGIVRPLAKALEHLGAETWLDESRLHVGDGLRRGIEEGVRLCDYAVAVLSPAFFASEWAQRELDSLLYREISERRTIVLPVRHGLDPQDVAERAPTLSDRVSLSSALGCNRLALDLLHVSGEPEVLRPLSSAVVNTLEIRPPLRGDGAAEHNSQRRRRPTLSKMRTTGD